MEFPGLEQSINSHIDTQLNTIDTQISTGSDIQLNTQTNTNSNTLIDTGTNTQIDIRIDTDIDTEIDAQIGQIDAQIDSHSSTQINAQINAQINTQPLDSLPPEFHQRFLRVSLGRQDSALVPLEQITEIVKVNPVDILPVPEMPDWVLGVCNWRGEMLWLIDFNPIVGYPSQFQPTQFQPNSRSPIQSDIQTHSESSFSSGSSSSSLLPALLMVLVVQIHYQSIGIVVPKINDIELYDLQQLQPPIPGLFPPDLLPLVAGVLPECCDPVVNIQAIELSPIWKKHQRGSGGFSS